MLDGEIKAFDRSVQMATKSGEVMIREAETALREKLIEVPDLISSAFAGAIAYGDDLEIPCGASGAGHRICCNQGHLAEIDFWAVRLRRRWCPSGGNIVPFCPGGIVDRPTIFPMAHGLGLMGEVALRRSCH